MLKIIYTRALKVLMKKPLALWGISLLSTLLTGVACILCSALPILAIAVCMLLNTSMTMVYLHGYRGEDVKVVHLFDCFRDWAAIKRVLCGMGWRALWIFLWALIPIAGIVFAVIRTYEYRLVPYILVTEPDVTPTEATKLSRERTTGYKGKMFLAAFFVYVAIFVISFILGLLSEVRYIGVLFGIIAFVFSLTVGALTPLFLGLVQAAFYEEITNPTIPATPAAVPVTPGAGYSFCPNCGAPVIPGSSFCTNCGSKLG